MLQGETLYRALEPSHPLICRLPIDGPGCFETFPYAITWHLRGGEAKASQKRAQRRELLQQAGIDLTPLSSIDWVDAALCPHGPDRRGRWRVCGLRRAADGLDRGA